MDWAFVGCACFVAAAFVTDIKAMKIPNKLTIPAMLSGLLFQGIYGGWAGLLFSLKGLGIAFGILLVMHWIGAVGAGDVKLFGGIGAWMGTLFSVQSIVYSVLFAGVIGILIVLWRRETFSRLKNVVRGITGTVIFRDVQYFKQISSKSLRFPFMLAVLPGFVVAYVYSLPY